MKNLKKTNLILIILVLALIGFVFYQNRGKGSSDTASVVITEDGFSPERITVTAGTEVTWINQGKYAHWPASNFHPTHTLYPEEGGCLGSMLDACKGLAPGESYSFKMNKIGLWPMHDHLAPGLVMVVEVVGEGQTGSPSFKYDEKTTVEDFRKYDYGNQLEFIKTMSLKSPARAWSYIKEAFVVNGQVVGNAHELAHIVGNVSYAKSGIEGIKICDATFAFGCFHGVTEAMLLKEGTGKIKMIEESCLKVFPPDKSQDYTGCIHGTGHGIYTWEKGDLGKSLGDCDVLNVLYRPYCYDGVFMENSSTPAGRAFDPKDPWKLCEDLPERYHRNCARYQSQVFLNGNLSTDAVAAVGKNCTLGKSALMRETCFESLGYYVAQSSLGNTETIRKQCDSIASPEGKAICTIGAAVETVFQRYGSFENSAKSLCNTLAEPRKSICMDRIISMLK